MKLGILHPLFSVMFSTFALNAANVIPQFLAPEEILTDESGDSLPVSVDLMDKEVKTENTHNSNATDINVRRQSEPETQLHIAEIVPEYKNEQYGYINKEKSRGLVMEPYHPRFHRRNLFDDYSQGFQPLHFYQKANGIPRFGKRFLGQRRHFDRNLLNNPGKADTLDVRSNFATLDSGMKSPFSKKVPLFFFLTRTNVPKTAITFLNDSKLYENVTARLITENANTERHHWNKRTWNVQYTIPFKNSTKNRNVFNVPAVLSPRGKIFLRDETTNENLNPKRVYFEKIPLKANLSWYVFVNCSRDSCQFTNSTNQTELLSEGWILHNCTNYGCTEMYPKTESVLKFIGLMLLIFTICIFKIVVFVLIFYYCRRLKLASKKDQDPDWDEEDFKTPMAENVSGIKSQNQNAEEDDFEPVPVHKKDEDRASPPVRDKELKSTPENKILKVDSKIWVPPEQTVASCVRGPTGSLQISKKVCEKVTPTAKCAVTLQNVRKNRSKIPRLKQCLIPGDRGNAETKAEREGKNIIRKIPKRAQPTTEENVDMILAKLVDRNPVPSLQKSVKCGDKEAAVNITLEQPKCPKPATEENSDILLMVLDDEISKIDGYYSPGKTIVKSPNWQSILEKESESFVSLDLTDGR